VEGGYSATAWRKSTKILLLVGTLRARYLTAEISGYTYSLAYALIIRFSIVPIFDI
jgi:hypothetical protein